MTAEETELQFIRCPGCRSLVPAVAQRCRMCGFLLAKDKEEPKAQANEEPFARSRVRQKTMFEDGSRSHEFEREEDPSELFGTEEDPQEEQSSDEPQEREETPPPPPAGFRFGESKPRNEQPVSGQDSSFWRAKEQPAQAPAPERSRWLEESEKNDDEEFEADEEDEEDRGGDNEEFHSDHAAADPVREKKRRRRRKKRGRGVLGADQQPAPAVSEPHPAPQAPRHEERNQPQPFTPRAAFEPKPQPVHPQREPMPAPVRPAAEVHEAQPRAAAEPQPAPARAPEPVKEPPQPVPAREVAAPSKEPIPHPAPAAAAKPAQVQPLPAPPVQPVQPARVETPAPALRQASGLSGWFVDFKQNSFGQSTEIRAGRYFVSGQRLRETDLVINEPSVSTPHCIIQTSPETGLRVQDLMSEKGTFLRRSGEQEYRKCSEAVDLEHGDWLKLGDYEVLVCLVPKRAR